MAKSLWRWTMWFAHLVSIGFFMIDDGMSLIKCGWLSARDGPKYMVCLSVPIKFISWAARKWVQASMSFATFFTVTLWIPLIHCNLTKDSIVSELSWSSNSLALSLSLYFCIGKLLLVSLAKAWRCIGQCAVATCKTKCFQVLICAVSYKQLICIVFTQYRCTVIIPTKHTCGPHRV